MFIDFSPVSLHIREAQKNGNLYKAMMQLLPLNLKLVLTIVTS